MTKNTLKIDTHEWMGDMLKRKLEPMAEFLLIKLMMIAEQASGWLCAGTMPFTDAELADAARVPHDECQRHLRTLLELGLLGHDGARGAYFIPERVKAADISAKRSAASLKGGGNPALRRREGAQEDLFKQNVSNVVSFDNSKTSAKSGATAGKKKKEPKKKNNNNNIYTPDNPLYFEHGCIRLSKRDYLSWAQQFPHVDLDAELVARANWLDDQPDPKARENWFISTRFTLIKRNNQAAARYEKQQGGAA